MEEGAGEQAAKEPRRRDTDAEGTNDALQHDKKGLSEAAVIADEAEKEAGQQRVNGIGLKVVPCREDDIPLVCKQACQQVAAEKVTPPTSNPTPSDTMMP